MPKYGIHHIVLREAVGELLAQDTAPASEAAAILQSEMPSATMGSIGPDIFFWGPDYEAVDKLYRLYENIAEFIAIYNRVVQPVRDVINAVGEPVEELVETLAPNTVNLIRKTLEEVKETAALFKAAVATGLFSGVLTGANIITNAAGIPSLARQFFQMFVPEFQHNHDETKWYWFDMLHYRHTGTFANKLVSNSTSPRQKAFAFGYLSHIATDVTGHPYVNQVCGTTYRLDVQRHVTAENFMDTWKYQDFYGESINETLFTRLGLPSQLPTDIGDLLHNAFKSTYSDVPHPTRLPGNGFYTREQIDQTYDVFYKVLELLDGQAVRRPEEPFSGVGDILSDALDAFSPPPSPPETSTSMCGWEDIFSFGLTQSSRDCYEEFFEQVGKWMGYLGELLVWTFETMLNLIDLLLSVFLALPISVLLAILYGIQLMCYEIYRTAKAILSNNGFVMPEPDELDSSIGQNLIRPFQCQTANFKTFPSVGKPPRSNLVCPTRLAEQPTTASAFHPQNGTTTPERFISQEPFNMRPLLEYVGSETPEQTRSIERDRISIGNAIDYTAWMIGNANDKAIQEVNPQSANTVKAVFSNWNLDADRGYGYQCWHGTINQNDPYDVDGESYV